MRISDWSSDVCSSDLTTSAVRHNLTSVFDATSDGDPGVPTLFEERNNIRFISHETRMSGGGRRTPWVAGIAILYNVNQIDRALGPPDAPLEIDRKSTRLNSSN